MASQNGHVEVVNILLQNGAHVDVQEEVSLTFSHRIDRAVKLKAVYVLQELSLVPRKGGRKSLVGLYALFAHARNHPDFLGIWIL